MNSSGDMPISLRMVRNNPRPISSPECAGTTVLRPSLCRKKTCDPRWRTHQMALGDASGSAPINVARNTVFSSFLLATALATDSFGDKPEIESLEIVSVRRLDGILDEVISHVDRPRVFLKIDAQGYDMRVLEGASGVLSRIEGIQTELSVQPIYHGAPPISEALSRLDAMGFDLAGLYPVGRDAALRVIEFDAMLIRRPGALPSGLDAQRPSFERQVQAA